MIRLEPRDGRSLQAESADPEGYLRADEDAIGDSESIPDHALVGACLRGNEDAFSRLVRRYLRKAMAVAMEYMGTREDAEDVVQDTFCRIAEKLHTFDSRRPFGPWFFTILRNTSRNAVKAKRVRAHADLDTEHASHAPSPFEEVRRRELRREIDDAIGTLPAMQRTCFRLCVVEGLTGSEAAAATGLVESTVRVHVFHARRTLQTRLEAWREEAGST
jgi:RNA polymerase sigma-70 factor (ECF subfamily)